MSKPKHSQEFLNKRRLMVFVPVPGVICLTLLFYLAGGGEGVTAAATANAPGMSGLNHTLPLAGKKTLFADKMEASKAPQDSTHRNGFTTGLAFKAVGDMAPAGAAAPAGGSPAAGAAAPAGGLNYTVQPGQAAGRYDATTDPNVVAMQSRMQRLQQQTSSQPVANTPAPVAAPPAVASTARPASAGGAAPAARDSRMDESLQELTKLKGQYQERLLAMNAPAAPAAVAAAPASKPSKGMTVIKQVLNSVVSTLTSQTAPATNGFHTLGAASAPADVNAVLAVIHSDQVVEQGSTVKLRLLNDVQLEGHLIPRNSFLYGVCSMSGNRLTINATSVQYQGSLLPVNLKAFDIDGGEGLNVPGSVNRDALKQGAATGVSGVDMLSMSPSLTAQAASIAIQTGKALTGRQIKSVKIHLKANYQLLLKS
ncbi:MAG: conjugative transposon protein TraM [Janthinobacterium lividum]